MPAGVLHTVKLCRPLKCSPLHAAEQVGFHKLGPPKVISLTAALADLAAGAAQAPSRIPCSSGLNVNLHWQMKHCILFSCTMMHSVQAAASLSVSWPWSGVNTGALACHDCS
jgi:hypothetical protein